MNKPKKRTEIELIQEVTYLKLNLDYYRELFKQREARPLLLPNNLTDSEKEWVFEQTIKDLPPSLYNKVINLLKECKPVTELLDVPQERDLKIITQ